MCQFSAANRKLCIEHFTVKIPPFHFSSLNKTFEYSAKVLESRY